MPGPKTNERPGTRATLRYFHMSASKARVVLDLIRDEDVDTAREILAGTTREAADVIGKVLASAVANAVNNDGLSADELYVSAAFADEGPTLKRFTPRARGRAGQIRKRSCHITVIVSVMDEDRLLILRAARNAQAAASRTRRVASSRRRADQTASLNKREATAAAAAAAADETELEANAANEAGQDFDEENFDEEGNEEVVDSAETSDEADDVESEENEEEVSDDTTEETN